MVINFQIMLCSEGEEGIQWSGKVKEKGQEVNGSQVEVGWVVRFPGRLEVRKRRQICNMLHTILQL